VNGVLSGYLGSAEKCVIMIRNQRLLRNSLKVACSAAQRIKDNLGGELIVKVRQRRPAEADLIRRDTFLFRVAGEVIIERDHGRWRRDTLSEYSTSATAPSDRFAPEDRDAVSAWITL